MNRHAAPLLRLAAIGLALSGAIGLATAQAPHVLALSTATLTTAIHDSKHNVVTSVPAGTPVHEFAQVSGALGTPTGTISVSFYGSGTCSGVPTGAWTATLAPSGLNTAAADVTASETRTLIATTVAYQARFNSAGVYASMTGPCQLLTVSKATPGLASSMQTLAGTVVTSVNVGTAVAMHVTVSGGAGTPTGSVVIERFVGGTCAGTATSVTVALPSGSGSIVSPSFNEPAGQYSFRATYTGNSAYLKRIGACLPISWTKVAPSATLRVVGSNNVADQPLVGHPASATVTVTGALGTPTGTVFIDRFATPDCSGGAASWSTSLSGGTADFAAAGDTAVETAPVVQSWMATYNGDSRYLSTHSSCHVIRWKATVTAIVDAFASASGSALNQEIFGIEGHLDASVRGDFGRPEGEVRTRFYPNGTCTGFVLSVTKPLINGDAIPATDSLALEPGSWSYQTRYFAPTDGSGSYFSGDGACVPFTISKAGVQLFIVQLDAAGAVTNGQVGRTAHPSIRTSSVGGTVDGTVSVSLFVHGGIASCSGTPVASASAVALVNGRVDITALAYTPSTQDPLAYVVTYPGAAHFSPASACIVLPVLAADATPPPPTPSPLPSASPPAPTFTPAPGTSAAPTLQPGQTPGPGATGAPGQTPVPGSSDGAGAGGPGSSLAPGQTPASGQSLAPVAAGSTGGPVATVALGNPLPTATGSDVGAVGSPLGGADNGGFVAIVVGLVLVGAGALALGLRRSRRRRLPGS